MADVSGIVDALDVQVTAIPLYQTVNRRSEGQIVESYCSVPRLSEYGNVAGKLFAGYHA
jgi:hypothetical protein